jgi:hypothetical protein
MTSRTRGADARVIDWEAAQEFANEEILQCLHSSPEFMSVTTLHEQYYHADSILNIRQHPAVLLSLIGRIFGVSQRTTKTQTKQ